MKSLEETVKEQGGEEFLAMVKEVKKRKRKQTASRLCELSLCSLEDLLAYDTDPSLSLGRPPVQAAGEHDGVCAVKRGGGRVPQEPHGVQHPRAWESSEKWGMRVFQNSWTSQAVHANMCVSKVIYNVDDGLSYDYRKKREIVISEAPSLQVFYRDPIQYL